VEQNYQEMTRKISEKTLSRIRENPEEAGEYYEGIREHLKENKLDKDAAIPMIKEICGGEINDYLADHLADLATFEEPDFDDLDGEGFFVDVGQWLTGKYPGEKATGEFLKKYGSEKINSITVYRRPLNTFLKYATNILTQGKLVEAAKQYSYDKLFHLFVVINNKFVTEKNETVNASDKVPKDLDKLNTPETKMPIPVNKSLTVGDLFENSRKKIGDKHFFSYAALSWNCQDFIQELLDASGLSNPTIRQFIVQNVEGIAKELPKYTNPLFTTITDFAALAKQAVEKFKSFFKGKGLNEQPTYDWSKIKPLKEVLSGSGLPTPDALNSSPQYQAASAVEKAAMWEQFLKDHPDFDSISKHFAKPVTKGAGLFSDAIKKQAEERGMRFQQQVKELEDQIAAEIAADPTAANPPRLGAAARKIDRLRAQLRNLKLSRSLAGPGTYLTKGLGIGDMVGGNNLDDYYANLKPGDRGYNPTFYDPDYASYELKKNTGYDSLAEQADDLNHNLGIDAEERYQLAQQNAVLQNPKIKADYDRLTGEDKPRGANKVSATDLEEFAKENHPPGNDPLAFSTWKNPPSLYDWFLKKYAGSVVPGMDEFNAAYTKLGWPAFDAASWGKIPDEILKNIWQHIQAGTFPNYTTERQQQDAFRKAYNDQQFWQGFASGFFKTFGPFEPLLQFVPGGDVIQEGLDAIQAAVQPDDESDEKSEEPEASEESGSGISGGARLGEDEDEAVGEETGSGTEKPGDDEQMIEFGDGLAAKASTVARLLPAYNLHTAARYLNDSIKRGSKPETLKEKIKEILKVQSHYHPGISEDEHFNHEWHSSEMEHLPKDSEKRKKNFAHLIKRAHEYDHSPKYERDDDEKADEWGAQREPKEKPGDDEQMIEFGDGLTDENGMIRQILHTVGTNIIHATVLLNQSKDILNQNHQYFNMDPTARDVGERIFNEIDKVVAYTPPLVRTLEPWLKLYGGALIVSEDEGPLREAVHKSLDAAGTRIAKAISLFKEAKTSLENHHRLLSGNAYLLKDTEKAFRDIGNIADHLTEVLKLISVVIHQIEQLVPGSTGSGISLGEGIEKGALNGYKTSLPEKERREILKKDCQGSRGAIEKTIKRVNFVANFNKGEVSEIAKKDLKWLEKMLEKYDDDAEYHWNHF
jgi:hypothetical protein